METTELQTPTIVGTKTDKDLRSLDPRLLDKRWRMENLYWIKDRHGSVVKFKFNAAQEKLFRNRHTRELVLKARQFGISTYSIIEFLDDTLFIQNWASAIVADKKENAETIFKKCEFAWQQFDPKLKELLGLRTVSDSASELEFSNGSVFRVGTSLHSGTYQNLHVSEYGPLCAKYPDKADDLKKSAIPTVHHATGHIRIESTAEGEGNDFHRMTLDAMETEVRFLAGTRTENGMPLKSTEEAKAANQLSPLEYKFFFFAWFEEPSYRAQATTELIPQSLIQYFDDLERRLKVKIDPEQRFWYFLMKKDLKERMAEQYPSYPEEAFLSTGDKLFNQEVLKNKLEKDVRLPVRVDGNFVFYAEYRPGHAYGLGADVSQGLGRDSSTMVVTDFTVNEVVMTYRSNTIPPDLFAHEIAKAGRIYGNCIVAPEANNIGHTTVVTLRGMYGNIYQYTIKGNVEDTPTVRLGWSTNTATRPRMLYEFSAALEHDVNPITIPDAAILREASMFNKEDSLTVTQAQQLKTTRHFDLLIAAAISWQMRSHAMISWGSAEAQTKIERNRAEVAAGRRRFR